MPFLIANNVLNSTDGRVAVQITDLFPHKTQSSAVYTPNFQGPQYLYAHGRDVNEDVATQVNAGGDTETDAQYAGISAYILATVEAAAGGTIGTVAANVIGTTLANRVLSGESLTLTDINAAINAGAPGATLTGGNSIGSVIEVLRIVSGYRVFTLPANTVIELANGNFNFGALPAIVGAATTEPADLGNLITTFSNSFYISARKGQLKTAQENNTVVCYADDGSLIQ